MFTIFLLGLLQMVNNGYLCKKNYTMNVGREYTKTRETLRNHRRILIFAQMALESDWPFVAPQKVCYPLIISYLCCN